MKKIMVLGISAVILLAGCSADTLPSVDQSDASSAVSAVSSAVESGVQSIAEQEIPLDYDTAVNTIDTFMESFDNYVLDNNGEGTTTHFNGTTLGGDSFDSVFYESADGVFKKATFEIDRDGILVYDEYFRMSDNLVFVSRCYMDENSRAVIERYLLSGDRYYRVDDENSVVTAIEDASQLDFFATFEQAQEYCGVS